MTTISFSVSSEQQVTSLTQSKAVVDVIDIRRPGLVYVLFMLMLSVWGTVALTGSRLPAGVAYLDQHAQCSWGCFPGSCF